MSAIAAALEEGTKTKRSHRRFFTDNARRMWGLVAETDEINPEDTPPKIEIKIENQHQHEHTIPEDVILTEPVSPPVTPPPVDTPADPPQEESFLKKWAPLIGGAVLGGSGLGGGYYLLNKLGAAAPVVESSLYQLIEDAGGHLPP